MLNLKPLVLDAELESLSNGIIFNQRHWTKLSLSPQNTRFLPYKNAAKIVFSVAIRFYCCLDSVISCVGHRISRAIECCEFHEGLSNIKEGFGPKHLVFHGF